MPSHLPVQEAKVGSLHVRHLRREGPLMDELVDHVCARMPVLARMVGRSRIGEIVQDSVAAWPSGELAAAEYDEPVRKRLLARVREHVVREKRYGNPILIMWAISIVINLVWQWWLSRRENQEKLAVWQHALESGS